MDKQAQNDSELVMQMRREEPDRVRELEAALAQANQIISQLRARLYGVLLLIRE